MAGVPASEAEQVNRQRGTTAARQLYDGWDPNAGDVHFEGETTPAFAEAFIDEYRAMQMLRAKSVDRVSSRQAGRAAVQLTEEAFRGILEVLQNAEDEEASYLKVALRRNGNRRELLFVHDGNRVVARTVVAMTGAYLSLKAERSTAIGKFGIGLKTLQKLGPVLEVHCAPYHWAITDGDAKRVQPATAIPDLYEPTSGQTLMVLRLHGSGAVDGLFEWFQRNDARTLLFLHKVRRVEYRELGRHPRVLKHSLVETSAREYDLAVGKRVAQCAESVIESSDGQSWRCYRADLPVSDHARRGKASGQTVSVGVAVPAEGQPGLLFSGLPTGEGTGLPFDIGGPFESDVSRERLDTGSRWNNWLLDEVRKFAQALAVRELQEDPARAWSLIGLQAEVGVLTAKKWLTEQMCAFVDAQQRAVAAADVKVPGGTTRMRSLAFESPDLESVLKDEDIESVRPQARALPRAARDYGRWRNVLGEVLTGAEIGVDEAMVLFDREIADNKRPTWFAELAAAAIRTDRGDRLFEHRSVLLADGERVAPCEDGHGCLLVSRELAGTDLITRLSLARQIHIVYTTQGKSAQAVRLFLVEKGAFSDAQSADAVLRALAGRHEDPVTLSDDDIGELATFLAEASASALEAIANDLGRAVTVDGFVWVGGHRDYRPVLPAESYLPAAMDEKDGWARAAGTTEGIAWIHPRYGKLKQLSDVSIGPRKLFRLLGAETAPRLRRPETVRNDIAQTAYGLGWVDLPELWVRGRAVLGERMRMWPDALLDDWTSPELLAAASDIAASKVGQERRERASALVRTLERPWSKLYEDASESAAVHRYRGKWRTVGALPTSWVARLADIEWLSDCASPASPVAPVNTRIRSDANASVYGNDGSAYAYELGPLDADSPVVRALGVGGLPHASEHLDALLAIRHSGAATAWDDVAHHYLALSEMCPARPTPGAEVDDMTVARLLDRFRSEKLLWCGAWLSPSDVYQGEVLFPGEAAFVPENPEYSRLWESLSIARPTAPDCVRFLKKTASAGRPPAEVGEALERTYRALSRLIAETSARVRKELGKLPVWTGERWSADRPVYYSESEVFARTLADADVPMWRAPVALHTLGELPQVLKLELISPADFAVSSRGGVNSVYDVHVRSLFANAVEFMRDFISRAMPDIEAKIPDATWDALHGAAVELVPALTLEGTVAAKRLSIEAHTYFDRAEMCFFFENPNQVGRRDTGGDLVADAFELGLSDKLSVSLAWVDAWQRAAQGEEQLGFPVRARTPDYIDGEAVPSERPAAPLGVTPKKKPKRAGKSAAGSTRELVDVDALVVGTTRAATTPPVGAIVATAGEVNVQPPRKAGVGGKEGPSDKKSASNYTPWDRETVGMGILGKVLAVRGIEIEDVRTKRTGADAIGTDGCYYELKVHAGCATGALDVRGSEVLQARELGERYVLVVVENVEAAAANPRVTFIPNPMVVLDVHPVGKIEVTGYDNEAFEQVELPRGQ